MRRRLTMPPRMRGLGDGFAGAPSNYWSTLAGKRVQLVMTPGHPSTKLVPKPTLRGYVLGDNSTPSDTFVGDDGCVYDTDGNRLTCPGGIPPSPAGINTLNLPQQPTIPWMQGNSANLIIPSGPTMTHPPAAVSWWNQSSIIPGVQNSSVVIGGGLLALVLGSMGGRSRR